MIIWLFAVCLHEASLALLLGWNDSDDIEAKGAQINKRLSGADQKLDDVDKFYSFAMVDYAIDLEGLHSGESVEHKCQGEIL